MPEHVDTHLVGNLSFLGKQKGRATSSSTSLFVDGVLPRTNMQNMVVEPDLTAPLITHYSQYMKSAAT